MIRNAISKHKPKRIKSRVWKRYLQVHVPSTIHKNQELIAIQMPEENVVYT